MTTTSSACYRSLKATNKALWQEEMARGCTFLRSRPRVLFVELTRFCNLSCPMCRVPGQVGRDQVMPSELFDRLAGELFPTAEIVDLRGWGESLILPHVEDTVATAKSYGCDIRIVTNLSFRRPEILQSLLEAEAYVGVSLDGASPELVQQLRGGARLQLIVDNLAQLASLYNARGLGSRLRLYVTCQRPNMGILHEIVRLAGSLSIGTVLLAPVTVDPASPLSLEGHQAELQDALSAARETAREYGITLLQTANLWEGQWKREDVGPCMHPWAYCYISYEGRVGFCDHLIGPHGDHFSLGDLRQNSFEEIWNSEAWVELRKEHLGLRRASQSLFSECAWCYKNRFVDFEDLIEPAAKVGKQYIWPA